MPEAASAIGAELTEEFGGAIDQADRRERRGEEAEEIDADLDDREEAAGVRLQVLHAHCGAVALVDELLDPTASERDERDLGRREDPVEQDQDDDQADLEEELVHVGA